MEHDGIPEPKAHAPLDGDAVCLTETDYLEHEAPAPSSPRAPAILVALRDPVVIILALAAFFDWISGNAIHSLLLGGVSFALVWDAVAHRPARVMSGHESPQHDLPATRTPAFTVPEDDRIVGASHTRNGTFLLLGAVLFSLVVGWFPRFSWPSTVAVIAVGAFAVVAGWEGLRDHEGPLPRLPRIGLTAWIVVFLAAALWELAALLLQPSLTLTSYAHPTISALADTILVTHLWRSLVLLGWLGLGWFLVNR